MRQFVKYVHLVQMGVQVHKAGRENTIIAVNTLMMISRVRIIMSCVTFKYVDYDNDDYDQSDYYFEDPHLHLWCSRAFSLSLYIGVLVNC